MQSNSSQWADARRPFVHSGGLAGVLASDVVLAAVMPGSFASKRANWQKQQQQRVQQQQRRQQLQEQILLQLIKQLENQQLCQFLLRFTYANWKAGRDKDNPSFYRNPRFRLDYARNEMPLQALRFKEASVDSVRSFVLQSPELMSSVSVLSLGCGPGSDISGFCSAFVEAVRILPTRSFTVNCLGVDVVNWEWQQNSSMMTRWSTQVCVTTQFTTRDMNEFVQSTSDKFDFVIMNFVGVKNTSDQFMNRVKGIVKPGGRILVQDNNIQQVRRLKLSGFTAVERSFTCDPRRKSLFLEFKNNGFQAHSLLDKFWVC